MPIKMINPRKILPALCLLMFSAGCSSFYYDVNGYYKSSSVPGWKYSDEKTNCMFISNETSHGIAYIVVDGDEEGTISFHGSFPLPEGITFQISDLTATIRIGDSEKPMPIECTLLKPVPAVFDQLPYPKKETYGFDRIKVTPGIAYDGHTMNDPGAIIFKAVPGYIEMSGTVRVGHVEGFMLVLPAIQLSGVTLSKFDPQFQWDGKRTRIMKRLD